MSATLLNNVTAILGAIGQGFGTTPVSLGPITFVGTEVPSVIRVHNLQQSVVRKRPGGGRTINLMGPDYDRIQLSGIFTGPSATSRARALAALRTAGQPVKLSYLDNYEQVIVVETTADLQQKGAVIPFTATLEVLPVQAATVTGAATSPLASLIGADAAAAVTSVTNTISSAASYVLSNATEAQSIVGQVAPIASMVGLGGPLASASLALNQATGFTNLVGVASATPSAIASLVTNMQAAGTGIVSTISSAGGSVLGISGAAANGIASDAPSLQEVTAQAGVLAGAVQAGGFVNASLAGVSQTQGTVQALPVVHS